MSDPLRTISTRITPQSEPIPGTVPNSTGGHAYPVDDWTLLRRFLILGTEGGSYYASERKLTRDNADVVQRCAAEDGQRTVAEIVAISTAGRAPRQQPAMFALAVCASASDEATCRAAFNALPEVARIGTHLFLFVSYVEQFRGWGRAMRRAVGDWYTEHPTLEVQLAKYRQREGWSHRDLLRLSKPTPASGSRTDRAIGWAVGKPTEGEVPPCLAAVDEAQTASLPALLSLIDAHHLPFETIPSAMLAKPEVWRALQPNMGLTALVRNLGRMTSNGALKVGSESEIVQRLADTDQIKRSRIHPMQILLALSTYATGAGQRGSLTWTPIPRVIDALNDAFYLAFQNVQPAGKRTLLALDVSGSMSYEAIPGTSLTPREASAAMAMVTLATEPVVHTAAFTGTLTPLGLSPRQRLDDVVRTVSNLPFGRTDCAQPMLYALANDIEVDTFIVYTDSETWCGTIHATQALRQYRDLSGIPAKLIVVGMVSNGFSIADPTDAGMLDVVGFDSSAPAVMADFARAGRAA